MLNLTLEELKERLSRYDELTLLEILDVTSEELVEFLSDMVEEKYDELIERITDDEEPED